MTRRTWAEMSPRQRTRVLEAMATRRDELAPLLEEIDAHIAEIGWRRAREVITETIYPSELGASDLPVIAKHGPWRYRVGKRNGKRILEALAKLPVELRLFE
jgi:hypothetical protein